jgi:hypothetical protein
MLPTHPDVTAAMRVALGEEYAQILDWAVRAAVEEMLAVQRRSIVRFRGSVRSDLDQDTIGSQTFAKYHLRGQYAACDGMIDVINGIESRDIVRSVAMRMQAVRLRREAQNLPWVATYHRPSIAA